MVHSIDSNVTAFIKESFGQNYEIYHSSYSIFSNLALPMALFLVCFSILVSIIWFLAKSLLFEEDNLLDKIIKVLLYVSW